MNVFPWIISIAWIIHRIQSYPRSRRSAEPTNRPYLWSQCYRDLGCINNTEEWYDRVLRPIKDRPLPRHIIKTTFILFSKEGDGVTLEPLSPIGVQMRATKFEENGQRTHLLIHDFSSNGIAGWIKHTAKSLLGIDAGNVISVDWTAGAEPPYRIAVQNARLVALEVANLLQSFLHEFERMSPGKFHLIGLGVGAHIAGYVGQKINGVGRITGLDPVGLYFKDMPPAIRLDPEDALFVDIINTDIESNHGQGSGEPFGHLNFFPNGGLTQMGCNATELYPKLNEITRETLRQGETIPGCSHKRSAKYFTASIDELNGKCIPMGYACADYSAFKRGECMARCEEGASCSTMGYSADVVANNYTAASTAKFFLDTNYYPPYCMFAYKITIVLGSEEESLEFDEKSRNLTMSGSFSATVFSYGEDIMFRVNLNLGLEEKPLNVMGDNEFLTYQKSPEIAKPDKMLLQFESENNGVTAYVRHVEIGDLPDYGIPTTRLCGGDQVTPLKNHDGAYFTRCDGSGSITTRGKDAVVASRQRRNPDEEEAGDPASETLDVSEYDESELPQPAEDDYYSNR